MSSPHQTAALCTAAQAMGERYQERYTIRRVDAGYWVFDQRSGQHWACLSMADAQATKAQLQREYWR